MCISLKVFFKKKSLFLRCKACLFNQIIYMSFFNGTVENSTQAALIILKKSLELIWILTLKCLYWKDINNKIPHKPTAILNLQPANKVESTVPLQAH